MHQPAGTQLALLIASQGLTLPLVKIRALPFVLLLPNPQKEQFPELPGSN